MSADRIVKAASIITMDPANPRAEAVAFDSQTGMIETVGTLSDCQSAAPNATLTDLGETVLLPGFVEAHSHPVLSGQFTQKPVYWIAPYVSCPTWEDVEKTFRQADAENPAGHPVFFNGLDRLLQDVEELTAKELDEYFPDRPAAVVDNSGHEIYFNSAVMTALGWSDSTPPDDPVGGHWGRNEDGTSNGRGYEIPCLMAVVTPLAPQVIPHPLASSASWYHLMAKNGITATSDMTYDTSTLPAYVALASVPDSPLRISLYHMSIHPDCGDKLSSPVPTNKLVKQGIKLWADGSPWVGTIAASFPYLDTPRVRKANIDIGPGGEKMMNYTRDELDAILDKYTPMGWQMAFHVNGDVGLDIVLDAYERALVNHGLMGTDHRWRVEHCGACRGDQFKRAADMGVAVSLAPFQFIYWGDLLDGTMFAPEIGSQWQRWGDAVRAGARVSFHNDGSVSPPIPLLNIQAAITRATPSGKVHGANQIISLDDALKCVTIDAAYTLHKDDEIGSIAVGKLADFVELSKDPYDADPLRLASEVSVLGTWVGGRKIDLDAFIQEINAIDPSQHSDLATKNKHCC